MPHERFRFKTLDDLKARIDELGLDLPVSEDLSVLARPVQVGRKVSPNSLGVHPMEGCDGTAEGKPDELTIRRYHRFARGGAGLLWFEATAVVPEGRANPRQLLLVEDNLDAFKRLREESVADGQERNGAAYDPYCAIQLTHSGRYSRPVDKPAPIIAHHDGLLDDAVGIPADYPLVTDDYLDRLQDAYVAAAKLAYKAGFDSVDIKSCHRYLLSELLACHTREGKYGGSFENRTRMLRETVARVRNEVPEIDITIRMNCYDGHPYPWGWGVSKDDPMVPDLSEPIELVGMLKGLGVSLVNVTIGNPYFKPHINRPFDTNTVGAYTPEEHPLFGVERIIHVARDIKLANPDMLIMGSGYSWLRQYMANVAAGVVEAGWADIVGAGRMAFAYPDFARDILLDGAMKTRGVCVACSRCTQIMRDHGRAGCAMFDREVYGPIYDEGRQSHS